MPTDSKPLHSGRLSGAPILPYAWGLATALGALAWTTQGVENGIAFAAYLALSIAILGWFETQRRAQKRAEELVRREAELELRKALAEAEEGRRTLQAIVDHIPEGLAIVDAPDGRISLISRCGAEWIGRPPATLLGIPAERHPQIWGLLQADAKTPSRAEDLPWARAARLGESTIGEELALRRPDGQCVTILCSAAPIRDTSGRITGALAAWRDISRRKQMEERLREVDKLESLGVLAGGVAHDFNNLLMTMMGHASLLRNGAPVDSPQHNSAQAILDAVDRASQLTRQMLAYSGKSRFLVESVDLSEFVSHATARVAPSLLAGIRFQMDLARDLPRVKVDVSQMEQLLTNLLTNGAEAIGRAGGCLRVSTSRRRLDETALYGLLASDRAAAGEYVVLEVEDTGCGIAENVLPRIFDPFFTTKFIGRGLGLSVVLGIVRGHSGALKVDSAPGGGTIFRVFLPAARETSRNPNCA
jgi:two-component system cell cycle sensor histidine kinase/response regulator CckA